MRMLGRLVLVSLLACPEHSFADDTADKSQFTLFNPTPDALMRGFASDRPTKSFTPYTVDAGHFQYEMDVANVSQSFNAGQSAHSFQALDPILKLGLTNQLDVEVQFGGYRQTWTADASSASFNRYYGFGDVIFQPRLNLFGNDGGMVAFSLIPYLKAPTAANGLGNKAVEGGLVAPLQLNLPEDFVAILVNEIDILKNAMDYKRHPNVVTIVNLEHPVPMVKGLTFEVEFYSSAGTDRYSPAMRTFDTALEYLISPNLQLDVGANIGLNAAAPRVQVYTGIAQRF